MARLAQGEKEWHLEAITRLLRRQLWGLTEQEIAEVLGWERRRVHNYLHTLASAEQIYREGRVWYAAR